LRSRLCSLYNCYNAAVFTTDGGPLPSPPCLPPSLSVSLALPWTIRASAADLQRNPPRCNDNARPRTPSPSLPLPLSLSLSQADAEKCGPKRVIIAPRGWSGRGRREGAGGGVRRPLRYDIIKSSRGERGGTRARHSRSGTFFAEATADPRRSGSPARRSSIMSYDRASRLERSGDLDLESNVLHRRRLAASSSTGRC